MNATKYRNTEARRNMVSYLADLIRDEGLDGPDVRDVATSVDWDDHPDSQAWVGPGPQTHQYLLVATGVLEESAEDLCQSATEDLGWGTLS